MYSLPTVDPLSDRVGKTRAQTLLFYMGSQVLWAGAAWLSLVCAIQVDPFDPKPRGVAGLNNTSAAQHRPGTQERTVTEELTAYPIGRYVQTGIPAFCHRVASQIESREAQGWSIDRVVVRGYADGIHNSGVAVDTNHLPASCRTGHYPKADDVELARLRACVVLDALRQLASLNRPAAVTWATDEYDEPDGGRIGDSYRKVVVEVELRR